jgi:hypothetical protein
MSIDDIEKIIADESGKTKDALEAEVKAKAEAEKKDPIVLSKEQQLANLNKAIAEANSKLKTIRTSGKTNIPSGEEEPELQVDLNDPNSKAWDKHIRKQVNPLQEENDREKDEIRTFALQKFLEDKPSLSNNPDNLKKVMETYEKIRTCTEKTTEGIMIDLKKAYAAEFADEIITFRDNQIISEARGDAIYSDPGVSRGSTSYQQEREKNPRLSREDEEILARWGVSPAQWIEDKKKADKMKAENK